MDYKDEQGADYYNEPVPTSSASSSTDIHLNKSYIKSIPGILKAVETICSLICMICSIASTALLSIWCGIVSGVLFIFSFVLYLLYLFNVIAKFPPTRIFIEWVYYLIMAAMLFITSIVAASKGLTKSLLIAFSAFGFLCTAALIADFVLKFKLWFSERRNPTTTSQGTTTNEPKY